MDLFVSMLVSVKLCTVTKTIFTINFRTFELVEYILLIPMSLLLTPFYYPSLISNLLFQIVVRFIRKYMVIQTYYKTLSTVGLVALLYVGALSLAGQVFSPLVLT